MMKDLILRTWLSVSTFTNPFEKLFNLLSLEASVIIIYFLKQPPPAPQQTPQQAAGGAGNQTSVAQGIIYLIF